MKQTVFAFLLAALTSANSIHAQSLAATQTAASRPTTQQTLATDEVRMRLFTPAWRYIGGQKPQDVAKNFAFIFGWMDPKGFHEGNPEAKCIQYMAGPYTDPKIRGLIGEEYMARTADGKIIKASGFDNWLVVPDHPKWIEYVQSEVHKNMDNTDWDGVFSDSMGTAPVDTTYVDGRGINPRTVKEYTVEEWLQAESRMLQAVNDALPDEKLHILNGLTRGTKYWTEPESASPRALLPFVDGAMSELIWRTPNSLLTDWPTVEQWMKDIRMIQDVDARGKIGFWWTKVWTGPEFTSTTQPNADKLIPQWLRFSLGSYLLAAGPRSYYNFDTKRVENPEAEGELVSNAAEWFPEYEAPLGTATGKMQQIGETGVYWRPFSNGAVVVNPTDKTAEGLDLPGDMQGRTFIAWGDRTPFTFPADVEAHTGLILTFVP